MSRPPGPPPYTAEQLAKLSTPKARFIAEAELRSYIVGHRLADERERALREEALRDSPSAFTTFHDQGRRSISRDSTDEGSRTSPYQTDADGDDNYQGQSGRTEHPHGSGANRRTVRIRGGYQPYPTTSEARWRIANRPGISNKPASAPRYKANSWTNLCPQFIATGINEMHQNFLCPPCRHPLTNLGKCARSSCQDIHDPSKIALCKSWLYKSECSDGENCDLSHSPSPHNTPHCLYHLQGRCKKSPCPFVHVDVDPATMVCERFGRLGYCDAGADCTKLHIYQCPEFANHGTCAAGNKCMLKHVQRASRMRGRNSSSTEGSPQHDEYIGDANYAEGADASGEPHAITQQHDYVPFNAER